MYMTWSGSDLTWQRVWIVALCIWLNLRHTGQQCSNNYRDQCVECKWSTGKRKCFFPPPDFKNYSLLLLCRFVRDTFDFCQNQSMELKTTKLNTVLGLHAQSERQQEASITWINKAEGISPTFSRHGDTGTVRDSITAQNQVTEASCHTLWHIQLGNLFIQ